MPPHPSPMQTLSPSQFRDLMTQAHTCLLDVRLPDEVERVALPGALNIPLHELAGRARAELPHQVPIAIYCHHGVRSAQAAALLERLGYADVSHLAGGIDAWADILEPALPRY